MRCSRSSLAPVDLYARGLNGNQDNSVEYLIDVNPHRDSLRKPHPGEDSVNACQAKTAWLNIPRRGPTRHTVYMIEGIAVGALTKPSSTPATLAVVYPASVAA